jgi:hypothetical protein
MGNFQKIFNDADRSFRTKAPVKRGKPEYSPGESPSDRG